MIDLAEKARLSADARAIEALTAGQTAKFRKAFLEFIKTVRSPEVLKEIRGLLEAREYATASRLVTSFIEKLGNELPKAFQVIGEAFAELTGRRMNAVLGFNATAEAAASAMQRSRLQFVQRLNMEQLLVLRTALTGAVKEGLAPAVAARRFRDAVGLTPSQWNIVYNYRRSLEGNSRDALDRQLRDRRFDRTVEAAIQQGTILDGDKIGRMVSRYAERMLIMRAQTIAQTEIHRVANQAQREAMIQIVGTLGIDPSRARKVWHAIDDDRTRYSHRGLDGAETGLFTPFVSPYGSRLMYPGDPQAPGYETINCRCVMTMRIIKEG